MKVDEFGVLKHIWYGKITNKNMEYLLDYPNVGFSGSIVDRCCIKILLQRQLIAQIHHTFCTRTDKIFQFYHIFF